MIIQTIEIRCSEMSEHDNDIDVVFDSAGQMWIENHEGKLCKIDLLQSCPSCHVFVR